MTNTKQTPNLYLRDIAHIGKNTFEGKLCEAVFKRDLEDRELTLIALVPDRNYCDMLVRACNAHEDMYEALKDAVFHLERLGFEEAEPQMQKIRAALAKAGAQ